MLTDAEGSLVGLYTDSDLARLLEGTRDADFDLPIQKLMTRDPMQVRAGTLVKDAMRLVATRKISELPVVDLAGRPAGIIDITDLVGLSPSRTTERNVQAASFASGRATVPFPQHERDDHGER